MKVHARLLQRSWRSGAERPRLAGWSTLRACAAAAMMLSWAVAPLAAGRPHVVDKHPRLFLRAEDVTAWKQRVGSSPEIRRAYEMMRKFAYGSAMQKNLWVAPDELSAVLVVYLFEDRDPRLLDRARRYLDAFERAEGDSWTRPRMLKALAHAYDWLHDDLSEQDRKKCAARMFELVKTMRAAYRHSDYNNHVYLERGPVVYAGLALVGEGINDSFARSALEEGGSLLKEHFIPAVNQLGGQGAGGWHESMSYFSFFAYELAHQLEAWRTATGEDLFPVCSGLRGAPRWMLHCSRPYDRSMAPIGDIDTPAFWGWQETAYFALLASRYRDGVIQHLASRVLPDHAARAWPYVLWFDPRIEPTPPDSLPTGTLFPGVGWGAMRSSWDKDACWSVFVCGDYYAGHQHSDQNSFIIARSGDLAIDAGQYGAKETLFHNTILLGDGQRVYKTDPRRFVSPTVPGSQFDTGRIVAFEENRYFTYVAGDASNAYGQFQDGQRVGKAPRFLRRYLFLKPSTFVIDDQVSVPEGAGPVRWLLHAHKAPAVVGNRVRISHAGGELICQTLLPQGAAIHVARQTGGRKNRIFHRVEITPREEAKEVRFLHVLHARRRGDDRSTAEATLEQTPEGLRLSVAAGARVFQLTLPKKLSDAPEIAIASADGQTVLARRLLPLGVLPYDRSGLRLLERWDAAYRRGRAPWDVGRPSSELKKAVQSSAIRPGRAVVLGCGAGTNAVYLAEQGFDVTAIDIAPAALKLARKRARQAGVRVRWVLADVLAPPPFEPFDFIFDRGCYHGVRRQNAAAYVETVRRYSHAGTRFLLLAGNANEPPPHYGPPRVKEDELRGDFSALFDFQWLRETRFDSVDPGKQGPLAWSALLIRKP